ncbi:glycosyltransferase family 2 protein [Actimicrobium sp. CCI2.3]|uniref:glycosyltransferase family 2 protein n=1 Tax=Actimicrobium sp. CCI2.3 TaxID=3048616 RepID=UPI002AB5796A|nr:glycosyltransferase family 2 protein [Actimicrobium sp. CCI2.3]MDY7576121.1 glycosyltransferase family 2 protein [Actimicrobium sp. CCI2.3]MEB0023477.1 glycosyltransferase family 2 protein [Actimicrobium sp. CCI2.3]
MSGQVRTNWPKVAVIIVNWNGAAFLERCVHALLNQTVAPHEIIVLDNASSDESNEIIERFASVRLIRSAQNTGFARGNNLAILSADVASEWIALLNPDAFADPVWLESLLLATERRPEFSAFGSKLVNGRNPLLLDGIGDAYHPSGRVWRNGHGVAVSGVDDQECEIFSACAAACLYRRDAIDALGGFDEDYFCYVEDVDLGFRLRLAGHRCLYVPQSVVLHLGSATTGGQDSDFAVYHGHRNLVWTFIKNMPGALFWLLLPLHLLLNVASILLFSLRGRGALILRAKYHALLGVRGMWRKRRHIQRNRVASLAQIWHLLDKRWPTKGHGHKKS